MAPSESPQHCELDTGLRTSVWEAQDTALPVLYGGASGQIVDLEPEAAVLCLFQFFERMMIPLSGWPGGKKKKQARFG